MARERNDPAPAEPEPPRETPAGAPRGEVLTLVCEMCGKDYFFEDEQPPVGMKCEKCGSTVFRTFHDHGGDEAADDFRDTTARDLHPDDPEGDVLPGDVMDLDNV